MLLHFWNSKVRFRARTSPHYFLSKGTLIQSTPFHFTTEFNNRAHEKSIESSLVSYIIIHNTLLDLKILA